MTKGHTCLCKGWYFQFSGDTYVHIHKLEHRFKEGREDVNDNVHPGCPCTSTTAKNIETVKFRILDYRRITVKEVTDTLAYRSANVKQLLWMFWHESNGGADGSKIA